MVKALIGEWGGGCSAGGSIGLFEPAMDLGGYIAKHLCYL